MVFNCEMVSIHRKGIQITLISRQHSIMAPGQLCTPACPSEMLSSLLILESHMATTSGEDQHADSIEHFEQAWQAAQGARFCAEKNVVRLQAPLGEAHRARLEAQAKLEAVRAQSKGGLLSLLRNSEEVQAAVAAVGLAMARVHEAEEYMNCALVMLEEAKQGEKEAGEVYQLALNDWRLEEQQQVCAKLEEHQNKEASSKRALNSLGWSG